jgi:hypothetical protein
LSLSLPQQCTDEESNVNPPNSAQFHAKEALAFAPRQAVHVLRPLAGMLLVCRPPLPDCAVVVCSGSDSVGLGQVSVCQREATELWWVPSPRTEQRSGPFPLRFDRESVSPFNQSIEAATIVRTACGECPLLFYSAARCGPKCREAPKQDALPSSQLRLWDIHFAPRQRIVGGTVMRQTPSTFVAARNGRKCTSKGSRRLHGWGAFGASNQVRYVGRCEMRGISHRFGNSEGLRIGLGH